MRLVTRGDLDGLTCAVLITGCEDIQEILLAHPQDISERRLFITSNDIIANLPYQPGCGKWFDHHLLTTALEHPPENFEGRYGLAPSAARVVYEYYVAAHPEIKQHELLLSETDRLDAAQLTLEDVTTTIASPFDPQVRARCGSVDCNEDGAVSAADLSCVVRRIAQGGTL